MHLQTIAPAIVVRACTFPIEALEVFGDRRLAALAADIDNQSVEYFSEAYEQAVARERQALWRETVGTPHFLKALALTNPAFAERAQNLDAGAPRRRHERRLEATLYRYLARAVGRTEPCDLWAGVTLARWGQRTTAVYAPVQYAIAPDLRPFRYILRQLAQRPHYRAKARYRVNATLLRQSELGWTFWARTESGQLRQRRLDGGGTFDVVLERMLVLPPLTPKEIAAEIGIEFETLRAMFDALIAGGAIVGGLDLPSSFETVWHALDQVEQQLEDDDRSIWHSHVAALHELCDGLEQQLEDLDVAAIKRLVATAASGVADLGRALATELPSSETPRAMLRCDLRPPFEIEFGPEARRLVEIAIASYDRFFETWSPAGLYRQAKRRQVAAQFPEGILLANVKAQVLPDAAPQTWQALAAGMPFASDLAARVAHWEDLLAAATDVLVCSDIELNRDRIGPGYQTPFASLLAVLNRGKNGLQLRIRGSLDDVTPLYARFAFLLDRCVASADLLEWVRASFSRLEERFDLDIAELKGLVELQPNASAGPAFAKFAIELWGATPGRPSLAHSRFAVESGIARLYLENRPKPLLVFACTAADVVRDDPFAQLLLLTSFRDAPTARFQASSLLFESELSRPRWVPRVELTDGSVVRPRRMVLCGERLNRLVGSPSAALRFAAWQQLARRHGWAPLLTIRRDNGLPLVVPRDSPLALEAAFAGVRTETRLIVVEEFDPVPWLEGPDGRHYTAEIAVPYERHRHVLTAAGGRAP